jgi:hypothetical protein
MGRESATAWKPSRSMSASKAPTARSSGPPFPAGHGAQPQTG